MDHCYLYLDVRWYPRRLGCKYGNMKLGKPNEKPEFKDATYFTMLFAAGIGIGLFYFGVGMFTAVIIVVSTILAIIPRSTYFKNLDFVKRRVRWS